MEGGKELDNTPLKLKILSNFPQVSNSSSTKPPTVTLGKCIGLSQVTSSVKGVNSIHHGVWWA